MGNPVTWFELNGPEPEQTAKFYSEVFGWHVQWLPEAEYALIDTHSGKGINGGLSKSREGQSPGSVFYAEDPDIKALLAKAESMGAKTVVPYTEIPDMATFAHFADSFGNVVGLVQGDGSINVSDGDNPPVDWFQIASTDPEKSWAFYRDLFGWKIEGNPAPAEGGLVHGSVDTGSPGARGGIGDSPSGEPHVMMYASVDNVERYLERAVSLGGKTIAPPMEVDEHTTIAAFQDPQGTAFGLYTYKP